MNNPPEQPRMSSLDRRIEAARRRGERERAAAHPQPTQGLTSTMSTESCDIAQPRNQVPTFLGGDWPKNVTGHMWAAIAVYGVDCSVTKELAPTDALVQAMKEVERMESCLLAEPTRTPSSQAMNVLCRALQEDPDYARSWHDNIAMAFKDSWEQQAINKNSNLSTASRTLVHNLANDAAARFMHMCFGADTSKHADKMTADAKVLAADPVQHHHPARGRSLGSIPPAENHDRFNRPDRGSPASKPTSATSGRR